MLAILLYVLVICVVDVGDCSCPHQRCHCLFLLIVHQSPVSSLQSIRHDLQPEPADSGRFSAYCPDYTVRALSDLQFIKVTGCSMVLAFNQLCVLEAEPAGHEFVWMRSRFQLSQPDTSQSKTLYLL